MNKKLYAVLSAAVIFLTACGNTDGKISETKTAAEKSSESTGDKMPEERKKRSEEFLKSRGIKINENLPVIENKDEADIKTAEETVKRSITAFLTANIACDAANGLNTDESIDIMTPILQALELEDALTDDEKKFWKKGEEPSSNEIINMTWRMEMCEPLFWACGLKDTLGYPNEEIDPALLVPILNECESFSDIMKRVKMRYADEILDEADLIYRMDWACVEGRIHGDNSAGDLSGDIVYERHKGFNWLIGAYDADNWDSVKAHT